MDDRRDRRTGVSMLTSRVSHLVKFCTGRYMLRLYVILEIPAQNKVVGKPYGTVLPHRRGIDSVPNFSVSISKSGFRLPFQTIFHFQTVWKCWEMEMENQRRRTGTRSYVYLWYCQMCSQSHARTCTTTGDFTQFVRGQMSCAHSVRFSKRLEISIPNGPFPFQTGRFHSKLRMRLEWKRIDRNSLIISRFSKPLF
jgi:hypothetical protein